MTRLAPTVGRVDGLAKPNSGATGDAAPTRVSQVTVDPLVLGAEVDQATERVLATAAALDDAALAAPSLLPGWTRGHVLAHLARNADSYVNLLTSARTGQVIPPYASPEARVAGIEAGAGRPLAEQLADLRASAERFRDAVAAMPAEAWSVAVPTHSGSRVAATAMWSRLREVEVHHVDLDAGYAPADWSEAFSHRLLHEVAKDLAKRDGAPPLLLRPAGTGHPLTVGTGSPEVAGSTQDLAGWLTGRSGGTGLTITPPGALPDLPPWI